MVSKQDALTGAIHRAGTELEHLPALIQRYKQAILFAAFSGELTSEWRASTSSLEPRWATLAEMVAEKTRNGLSVRGSDWNRQESALYGSARSGAELLIWRTYGTFQSAKIKLDASCFAKVTSW